MEDLIKAITEIEVTKDGSFQMPRGCNLKIKTFSRCFGHGDFGDGAIFKLEYQNEILFEVKNCDYHDYKSSFEKCRKEMIDKLKLIDGFVTYH